jgi:uncharacterized protein (TIGR00730 family)
MNLSAVCLFCGSSPGARPEYLAAARGFGATLARRGIRLVYGGGSVGLMGAAADACLEEGGQVVGVITRQLLDLEVGHRNLTRLEVVATMHERKARMASLADGFVSLPGGMGTLEETFEMLTWAQLQIHRKPCGLLDVAGYYDSLLLFVRHMVGERFLLREHADLLVCEPDLDALLDRMAAFRPASPDQWLERKVSGAG